MYPSAPTPEASLALLRQRSPSWWTGEMCRKATRASYGDRWKSVPFRQMMDEFDVLYYACLVAVMPHDAMADNFRAKAADAYNRAAAKGSSIDAPDFTKTYGIKF